MPVQPRALPSPLPPPPPGSSALPRGGRSAWPRALAFGLAAPLGLALAFALALAAAAPRASAQEAAPAVQGSLAQLHGVEVLRVHGNADEMGYAHGYLLAERIVRAVDAVVGADGFIAAPVYEGALRPMLAAQVDLGAYAAEIDGIARGVHARLGAEKTVIPALKRPLVRDDIVLLNIASDLKGMLCSSFSAFGERQGGETITARNLDYYGPALVQTEQLVIVFDPADPKARAWTSIAWPGVVGCFTGVNEHGLSVLIHDTNGFKGPRPERIVPRGIALRAVIERAANDTASADALRLLQGGRFVSGGNAHLSVPFAGDGPAAWVIEFDGAGRRAGGAELRGVDTGDVGVGAGAIICTNHFRARRAATACDRYAALERALADASAPVTLERARALLGEVAFSGQRSVVTVHSIVVLPNRRELYLGLADGKSNGPAVEPVRFGFDELFPVAPAGSPDAPAPGAPPAAPRPM